MLLNLTLHLTHNPLHSNCNYNITLTTTEGDTTRHLFIQMRESDAVLLYYIPATSRVSNIMEEVAGCFVAGYWFVVD